jgi:hypothetical protein
MPHLFQEPLGGSVPLYYASQIERHLRFADSMIWSRNGLGIRIEVVKNWED